MTTKSMVKVDLDERDRLLQWMKEKEIDFDTLGEITGDSYAALFLMLRADPEKARPINDKFKWRFAQSFGLVEAAKVFLDTPPITIDAISIAA